MDASISLATGGIVSGRSMVNSEYVYVGTPEETLLETYFIMLSKFNFERAKDQCDREKESKSGSGGTNWCEFMMVLGKLAMAEMNYYNLSFVGRTWIIMKKESLKMQYDQILQDAKRIYEVYYHRRGGTDLTWERRMAELLSAVMEFIAARKDMTDVYKNQELMADGCQGNNTSWYRVLKDTHEKHRSKFLHEYLAPLRNNFTLELGILIDLMNAQLKMAEWQFFPSLLSLQGSHTKLQQWCGIQQPGLLVTDSSPRLPSIRSRPRLPNSPSSSSPSSSSSSSLSSIPLPSLYRWLSSLHTALMAKFTLYFCRLLNSSGMMAEVKGLSSKFEVDYIQSLFSLVRQTQTCCVCLVFDSTGLSQFKGPEYHLPSSPAPELTGLSCYPIMTAIPPDFDFLPHHASIVSMVMTRGSSQPSGGSSNSVVSQHDSKLQCCYHMLQLEARVTMVAVVSQYRRREKDTMIITALNDLASKLKNQHIFQLLRNSSN